MQLSEDTEESFEVSLYDPKHSYVYTFANSLDGKIFYIGKGTKGLYGQDRIRSHLQEASGKRVKISRVAQRIREIWQQSGKVIIRKPYNALTNLEANHFEQFLLKQYDYEQLVNQNWHACHKNHSLTGNL